MRYVSLAVYVIVGFLIGNTIADLIVEIAIPTWRNHLGQTLLILVIGGAGAFGGWDRVDPEAVVRSIQRAWFGAVGDRPPSPRRPRPP